MFSFMAPSAIGTYVRVRAGLAPLNAPTDTSTASQQGKDLPYGSVDPRAGTKHKQTPLGGSKPPEKPPTIQQ